MDPAPDPSLFASDLQVANKNKNFVYYFLLIFFESTFTRHSSKIKSHKEATKQ
jgi:hypothetical protein